MQDFDRITLNPLVMGGKPCIRGMRLTVGMIVGQIGAGVTIDELLADYPYLEREDILQAVSYAGWLASGHEVELPGTKSPTGPSWDWPMPQTTRSWPSPPQMDM
jgi:uncharacterized protein (DUF433 family)